MPTADSPTADSLTGRSYAAVLFDMDGTLINSIPATVAAWTQWAIEYNITAKQLEGWHGVPSASIVQVLVPDRTAEALARVDELELASTDGITALPGALAALEALGDRAAIVTSASRALALKRLGAAGLPLPPVVVTVDDVTAGKPDPEPYLLAAQRLGVDPQDCLVVEDAPAGLASGRGAGCVTLGLTTTHQAAELNADAVVADLSAIRFGVVGTSPVVTVGYRSN